MYILLHTYRQHKKERPYSLKNHKPKTLAPPTSLRGYEEQQFTIEICPVKWYT